MKTEFLRARFRDIPLRYRLSIPFFFLALLGTVSLVSLGLLGQSEIIRQEESERLRGYDCAFDYNLELQGRWAVSLASSFARNPEVAKALAEKDRLRLIELCYPAYLFMRERYDISQFNFHELPPRNFLRLQRLYEYGDRLDYRQTILDTVSGGREVFGLESGITGYGIRGVAPVFDEDRLVGTIEIGLSFGAAFLKEMKNQFGIEASILVPGDESRSFFTSLSTTFPYPVERRHPAYAQVFQDATPRQLLLSIDGEPYAELIRPVRDYKGRVVGLAELCSNRTQTLAVMAHYRRGMVWLVIVGMILSVGAIYWISAYFVRPIGRMVTFAREIAGGGKVYPLDASPQGELRILAGALTDMYDSLHHSEERIRDYTENLEEMILDRTRALRESEEKYRTLVENVPLVVYRLLGDGKIIYVNHFVEDLMGFPPERVMRDVSFWKDKVWEEDRERVWPLMDRCLAEGHEFKAEYRVRHVNGKPLFVLDHALPVFDERGHVETVDGFLVDVTDRHCLQKQIIQTEELRTLTEVSARLAHEIRNPLVAAGGFARRLQVSLSEDDPRRQKADIVVQEVARLEKILERTLAYLKPFEIAPERTSLNSLVMEILEERRGELEEKNIALEARLTRPLRPGMLDRPLFRRALENILLGLVEVSPESSAKRLEVRTTQGDNTVHVEMILQGVQVSEDDIAHFFYPFTTGSERVQSLDLPMAKMIIHKHQGLIRLRRKEPASLLLDISLPL